MIKKWVATVALAATLTGCYEGGNPRPAPQPRPVAPVVQPAHTLSFATYPDCGEVALTVTCVDYDECSPGEVTWIMREPDGTCRLLGAEPHRAADGISWLVTS